MKIAGLIPAAGNANRLSPLPFSKELYPINFDRVDELHPDHPKTSMQYLLENMKLGGAENVFIVIRDGKWDIPSYFGDGSRLCLNLAYLMMGLPFGPPFSLNQAYSFLDNQIVLFGFPDILVTPPDSFKELVEKLSKSDADAILGLHKVDEPFHWDMVRINEEGRVTDLTIKEERKSYNYGWAIMAWKPSFTLYLNEFVQKLLKQNNKGLISYNKTFREPIVSDVVKAALDDGLWIDSFVFEKGKVLDVGVSERIKRSQYFFK